MINDNHKYFQLKPHKKANETPTIKNNIYIKKAVPHQKEVNHLLIRWREDDNKNHLISLSL